MAKDCGKGERGNVAEVLTSSEYERVLCCSEEVADEWYIDSGASRHMSKTREPFVSMRTGGPRRRLQLRTTKSSKPKAAVMFS